MKISNKKLEALREYFIEGGSTEEADVMEQIGTEDADVMQVYIDTLRQRFPEDFGGDPVDAEDGDDDDDEEDFFKVPAPEEDLPVTSPVKVAQEPKALYQFKDDNNVVHDLEVLRIKDNRIILQLAQPREEVTLVVKGRTVTVDLIQLRKNPDAISYGVTHAKLIALAELAK